MTEVRLHPGTTARVTPRDAASLLLGDAASGAEVSFSPARGEGSTATAGDWGRVPMPAVQPPDLVGVSWEEGGATLSAAVEVVAAHYCATGAILAHGPQGDTPADHGATEEGAWAARARATEAIEAAACRRFVPTLVRQRVRGHGSVTQLDWPDASSVEAEGAEDVTPFLSVVGDAAVLCQGEGGDVTYVAGLPSVPAPISAACEALAASYLVPSRIPDRATGESTEAGMLHYTLAGIDGATGIPDVDAAIKQHGRSRAAVL